MRRRLLFGYLTITVLVLLILEIPLGFAYSNSEQRRLRSNVQHDALALSIRLHESVESNQEAAL
ncbi:MAG: sensor histidine kinase, partial [Acidimicrobiia bacterium]|nr:sensor histidine kinase [Acidimicrobiia bacterium]